MLNLDFQQQQRNNNWTHDNIQKVKSIILPLPRPQKILRHSLFKNMISMQPRPFWRCHPLITLIHTFHVNKIHLNKSIYHYEFGKLCKFQRIRTFNKTNKYRMHDNIKKVKSLILVIPNWQKTYYIILFSRNWSRCNQLLLFFWRCHALLIFFVSNPKAVNAKKAEIWPSIAHDHKAQFPCLLKFKGNLRGAQDHANLIINYYKTKTT